jgi:hypothetical protein
VKLEDASIIATPVQLNAIATSDVLPMSFTSFVLDTSAFSDPIGTLYFIYWGDTDTNILSWTSINGIHQCPVTSGSNGFISINQCLFPEGSNVYANFFKTDALINCVPNAFSVTPYWFAQQGYSSTPTFTLTTDSTAYYTFTNIVLQPDDFLILTFTPPYQVSFTLQKSYLEPGFVPCTTSCGGNYLDLTTFDKHIPVADKTAFFLYDYCFHCGGAYSQFVLSVTNSDATPNLQVTANLQSLSPVPLTSKVQQTIGSSDNPGIVSFVVNNFDYTKGQAIDVNVTSGAVSFTIIRKYNSPLTGDVTNCPTYQSVWRKWCMAGADCQFIYTQEANYPGYSALLPPDSYYVVIIGYATFYIQLEDVQCSSGQPTSSQSPFCHNVQLPSNYLSYSIQNQDLHAQILYNNLAETIATTFNSGTLPSSCASAIKNFACQKSFPVCSNGFTVGYSIPHATCWDVYASCGNTMQDLSFPQYSCSRLQFTGANNPPLPPPSIYGSIVSSSINLKFGWFVVLIIVFNIFMSL